MARCCERGNRGDGVFPWVAEQLPEPGRQLPQAKPGWWLGRETGAGATYRVRRLPRFQVKEDV